MYETSVFSLLSTIRSRQAAKLPSTSSSTQLVLRVRKYYTQEWLFLPVTMHEPLAEESHRSWAASFPGAEKGGENRLVHSLCMRLITTEFCANHVCPYTYVYWWRHKLAALMSSWRSVRVSFISHCSLSSVSWVPRDKSLRTGCLQWMHLLRKRTFMWLSTNFSKSIPTTAYQTFLFVSDSIKLGRACSSDVYSVLRTKVELLWQFMLFTSTWSSFISTCPYVCHMAFAIITWCTSSVYQMSSPSCAWGRDYLSSCSCTALKKGNQKRVAITFQQRVFTVRTKDHSFIPSPLHKHCLLTISKIKSGFLEETYIVYNMCVLHDLMCYFAILLHVHVWSKG